MILKQVDQTEIFITKNGRLSITQFSVEHGEMVTIYLSPNQFLEISAWFDGRLELILDAWNDGVEYQDGDENGKG